MSLSIDDKKLLEKYNAIWARLEDLENRLRKTHDSMMIDI